MNLRGERSPRTGWWAGMGSVFVLILLAWFSYLHGGNFLFVLGWAFLPLAMAISRDQRLSLMDEDGVLNQMDIAVLMVDGNATLLDINEAGAGWVGKARVALRNQPIGEVFGLPLEQTLRRASASSVMNLDLYLDSIQPARYVHVRVSRSGWKPGFPGVRLVTMQDVTRFFEEKQKIQCNLALLEATLSDHHNGMMITDPMGRVIYRSNSLIQTFGIPEQTFDTGLIGWRGKMARLMRHPDRFLHFLDRTIQETSGENLEVYETTNGRWLECRSRVIQLPEMDGLYRVWLFHDFTEQMKREQELQRFSMQDGLTGAYNRAYFDLELRRMQLGRRFPVAMVMVDVDGLKAVNDQKGHEAGDYLLRQTVDLLHHACRADDVVARLGGDEFAILLAPADEYAAEQVAERIRSLQNLYNIRQPELSLSLSCGWAVAENPNEVDTLFNRSDRMMYLEKRRKKP